MIYFAYGSNLDVKQMVSRCPSAKPLCRATLRFHRLTYRANFSDRGVATVVRNEQRRGAVYGALYQVSKEDMKQMDKYEGYPSTYFRAMMTVETKHGNVKAIVYIMQDYFDPKKPSWEYLAKIQSGYRQWRIPLEKLEIAPTADEMSWPSNYN